MSTTTTKPGRRRLINLLLLAATTIFGTYNNPFASALAAAPHVADGKTYRINSFLAKKTDDFPTFYYNYDAIIMTKEEEPKNDKEYTVRFIGRLQLPPPNDNNNGGRRRRVGKPSVRDPMWSAAEALLPDHHALVYMLVKIENSIYLCLNGKE